MDAKILTDMITTPAQCELGYTGCKGTAVDYVEHPTGVALGEDGWGRVWVCDGDCAWEAARDS